MAAILRCRGCPDLFRGNTLLNAFDDLWHHQTRCLNLAHLREVAAP